MAKGTKVKTQLGGLKYVFIKGEGRNGAMAGEEPRMQYMASLVVPENGPEHKHFLGLIDAEWEESKKANGWKGKPKTNGIKLEMAEVADKEDIDPETDKVRKEPTGNVIIGFKTNTTWANGKPQVIKVFDHKGADITVAYANAPWSIGADSTGIIHGTAQGNDVGGTAKVTLYLSGVQIGKLVKYEGDEIETDEIDGDDIDLGDSVAAIDTSAGEQPDI